jgi:hypothetical protein
VSAYAVDEICWRVLHDRAFRDAMRRDPAQAIARCELSHDERAALLGGEVGRLYRLGAHPFLLRYLAIYEIGGLTAERYSERMRAAGSDTGRDSHEG